MHNAKKLEAQMRYQLFGRKAKPIAYQPGLQVILSVREKWGGPVKRFAFQSKTIGRFDAQMQAEKEARAQGFHPHAVLYIGNEVKDINADLY